MVRQSFQWFDRYTNVTYVVNILQRTYSFQLVLLPISVKLLLATYIFLVMIRT